MKKLFIDGEYGIAGFTLKQKLIYSHLNKMVELISINGDKDIQSRLNAIKQADIAVLCLPDLDSKEIVELLNKEEVNTTIIDASRYHRVLPGWTYGYFDLNDSQREKIINSKKVANPGCFANGMLSLLNPIKDYLKSDVNLILNGVTGYSAGGKKTIYKQESNPIGYRVTSQDKEHDHIKEVKHWLNLQNNIIFTPSVASFYNGQLVSVPIMSEQLTVPLHKVLDIFVNFYKYNSLVNVYAGGNKSIIPERMAGRDDLEIIISQPTKDYVQIHAVYDNLGRGSSGSILKILEQIVI